MRILAILFVLGCGTAALLGCAGGEVFVGCRGNCQPCSSDSDCCGSDQCFPTSPFGDGRCQAFPGAC